MKYIKTYELFDFKIYKEDEYIKFEQNGIKYIAKVIMSGKLDCLLEFSDGKRQWMINSGGDDIVVHSITPEEIEQFKTERNAKKYNL